MGVPGMKYTGCNSGIEKLVEEYRSIFRIPDFGENLEQLIVQFRFFQVG